MRSLQEIYDYIYNCGSDNSGVFGGLEKSENSYYLQQENFECAAFFQKYNSLHIKKYGEIGVAAGGFARLFSEFNNIETMYLFDLGEHPAIPKAFGLNYSKMEARNVISWRGNSHSKEFEAFLMKNFLRMDWWTVDAGHEYEDVIQDLNLALRYSHPHTNFFLHDNLVCPGVQRAINEVVGKKFRLIDVENDLYVTKKLRIKDNFSSGNVHSKGIIILEWE